jgi:nuclear protein localization family protein 4
VYSLEELTRPGGTFVYLAYLPDACSARPLPPNVFSASGSFGKKMTMDDPIAC